MNLITKASDTEKTIFLKGKAEKLEQQSMKIIGKEKLQMI